MVLGAFWSKVKVIMDQEVRGSFLDHDHVKEISLSLILKVKGKGSFILCTKLYRKQIFFETIQRAIYFRDIVTWCIILGYTTGIQKFNTFPFNHFSCFSSILKLNHISWRQYYLCMFLLRIFRRKICNTHLTLDPKDVTATDLKHGPVLCKLSL